MNRSAVRDLLRRMPGAAAYRFVRDLLRRIPGAPAYVWHCIHSRVIAGPGILGFNGGAFNPGAVQMDSGDIVLLAKAQFSHWRHANVHNYLKGAPVLIVMDPNLRVRDCHTIESRNFPDAEHTGIEDFRTFRYSGEIWVSHGMIPIKLPPSEVYQVLSILDPKQKTLSLLGRPGLDLTIKPMEKNWLFWSEGSALFLFYTFNPYRVLKLVDRESLTFATVINQPLPCHLSDIGGRGTGMISFSTNPIVYDDQHLILLIHQYELRGWDRFYRHWGVLIDRASLLFKKFTSAPIFSGQGARGEPTGYLYVMSVIGRQEEFIFFCGEGDAYLTRMTVSRRKLEDLWISTPVKRRSA